VIPGFSYCFIVHCFILFASVFLIKWIQYGNCSGVSMMAEYDCKEKGDQ